MLFLASCGSKEVAPAETNTNPVTNTPPTVSETKPAQQQSKSSITYNDIFDEKGNLKSVCNLFKFLQDSNPSFKLTEKAITTLTNNEKLFLDNSNSKIDSMTDLSINNKMLTKNIDKYGDKLILVENAYVIAIKEQELENITISTIQVSADDDIYYIYSLSTYDNVFDGDIINIYGLPIGQTSYENVSGGATHAIVLAGAYIVKAEQ